VRTLVSWEAATARSWAGSGASTSRSSNVSSSDSADERRLRSEGAGGGSERSLRCAYTRATVDVWGGRGAQVTFWKRTT
jgi:hypothetical protein